MAYASVFKGTQCTKSLRPVIKVSSSVTETGAVIVWLWFVTRSQGKGLQCILPALWYNQMVLRVVRERISGYNMWVVCGQHKFRYICRLYLSSKILWRDQAQSVAARAKVTLWHRRCERRAQSSITGYAYQTWRSLEYHRHTLTCLCFPLRYGNPIDMVLLAELFKCLLVFDGLQCNLGLEFRAKLAPWLYCHRSCKFKVVI